MHNREKIIAELDDPVYGTMFIRALEVSEDMTRHIGRHRGRTNRSVTSAARSRWKRNDLVRIINYAVAEGKHAAAAADISASRHRLRDEGTKSFIKSNYLTAA